MARPNDGVNHAARRDDDASRDGLDQVERDTAARAAADSDSPMPAPDIDPFTGRTKLSMALMGCTPELVKLDPQQREALGLAPSGDIPMARVYGILTGLTDEKELKDKVTGKVRMTRGLVGDIECVNLVSGQVLQAGVFYAPSGFHEMMLARLQSELARTAGNMRVAFELEFHATPDSNPRGYSWKLFNRGSPRLTDPLAPMRRRALADSTKPEHVALVGKLDAAAKALAPPTDAPISLAGMTGANGARPPGEAPAATGAAE